MQLKPRFSFVHIILLVAVVCAGVMLKYGNHAAPIHRHAAASLHATKAPRSRAPQTLPVYPIPPKIAEELSSKKETTPTVAPTPIKSHPIAKAKTHKHYKKVAHLNPPTPKPVISEPPVEIADSEFEVGEGNIDDWSAPLDVMAYNGLSEESQEAIYDSNPYIAATQLDDSYSGRVVPLEKRFLVIEGEIQRNDYSDIHEKIKKLSNENLDITAPKPKAFKLASVDTGDDDDVATTSPAQPTLVAGVVQVPTNLPTSTVTDPADGPPSKGDSSVKQSTAPVDDSDPDEDPMDDEPTIAAKPNPLPQSVSSESDTSAAASVANTQQSATIQPSLSVPSLAPMSAAVPVPFVNTQSGVTKKQTTEPQLVKPPTPPATPPAHGQAHGEFDSSNQDGTNTQTPSASNSQRSSNRASRIKWSHSAKVQDDSDREDPDAGTFFGNIYIEEELNQWLQKNKGHVELYLHRENSRDPQDTRFIDYEYGDEEFQFEGQGMQGKYILLAAIYSGATNAPVAQISYPKRISSGSYKEKIHFYLNKSDFDRNASTEAGSPDSRSLALNLTVFEGAPGNYREAKPVADAQVKVVGYPDWGYLNSDQEGNLQIQNVTPRSEYLLEVSASGYYPTRQIVPVFDSVAYSAIYLIPKDKVETITKYFTKHDQQSSKAIVMGRVYNPQTRVPQRDEEIYLSFRRGRALYFDALPNVELKQTTDTGLFGFFNVEASFRTLQRASGKHSLLTSFLPGYGQYVEFGRGGTREVKGRFFDPFQNEGVDGMAHLVGDENNDVPIAEGGEFVLPDVDLPSGILTIEVKSSEYPLTWHSIPWSTRQPEKSRNLFMLSQDVLSMSKKVNGVSSVSGRGSVVGGAEPGFFRNGRHCVSVSLLDSDGSLVGADKGPFPMAGAKSKDGGFCLTKQAPGFGFFNLPTGEYILKWHDERKEVLRTHMLRVGMDRVSVVIN